MPPPSITVDTSSSPFVSDLDDDSRLESECLLSLCKQTLAEADCLTSAMRSCICEGYSALYADLFGDSLSEPETPLSPSIYDDSIILPLPDSLLDESVVSETQGFESVVPETQGFESVVPETQGFESCNWSRKRKVVDAWTGPATAVENDRIGEEMLHLLLPRFFCLVRSFP